MELRNYLQVVQRRRWVVVLFCLLGLALGAASHVLRTPVYEATTTLLLQPNDPAERVTPEPGGFFDPDRFAADQVIVVTSEAVLRRAAARVGQSPRRLAENVEARIGDSSGVISVSAQAGDAEKARTTADALAVAYIEDRRDRQVEALQRAAGEINVQLDALRDQIATLREDDAAPGRDAALDAANQQFTSLFVRQQDLLIDATLKTGGAEIVAPATAPDAPVGVSLPAALVLGGLLGLMVGLGAAFLRDQLDDRVRSRAEVERLTGHPVLADLPLDRRSAKQPGRLAMQHDSHGALAEATRTLRTSISFLGVEKPVRRLMVTSAVPGEGKTLVAANLAVAFAQAGTRTVLVSADLRRPRVEALLGVGPVGEGLSTVLGRTTGGAAGRLPNGLDDAATLRVDLRNALHPTAVSGLALLPAGISPPNPAELLASHRMDQVLDALEETFDLVVLDTTPTVPVTDAAALASKAGRVLLVTASGTSRRRAVERMVEILRLTDADILGAVLNRAKPQGGLVVDYYGEDQQAGGRRSNRGLRSWLRSSARRSRRAEAKRARELEKARQSAQRARRKAQKEERKAQRTQRKAQKARRKLQKSSQRRRQQSAGRR